jgi:hypothetical protein
MTIQWSNNASGALASSISPSSTTIVLAAGQGVEFPLPGGGDYFYATLTDPSNNLEIVKVTARTADTLTVVRGQDNTTARSYAAGDLLELRPTAAALLDMQTGVARLASNNVFTGNNTYSTEHWTINEVSGKLVFSYSGVAKFSISSTGAVVAASDVTTDGTP